MSEPVWIDKDLGEITPTDEQIQTAANTYLERVIINPDSPPLDRGLSSNVSAAPADMVGDIKNKIRSMPQIAETDETGTSIDIADAQGYVIARFSNGHIKTKSFDSADVPTQEELEQVAEEVMENIPDAVEEAVKDNLTNVPKIAPTTESSDSLDIADVQGNILVRFKDGHIQTKSFDSSEIQGQGFEWKFSGNDLLIGYGYNDTIDAVVVLNEGRANGLFDFAKLCSKPKGIPLDELETTNLTVIWNSSTDMHGPFQFLAVNNPDGEHADATDPGFTGGNHTLDSQGSNWKTASSKGVRYFADGRQVTSGHGRCNHFEMRWANGVQAYNTAVEGGTGRECLTEYHDMVFNGIRFDEHIRLVPSEDIKMKLWYGLQFVGFGSIYTSACFRDAINRQIYTNPESTVKSGNAVTSAILAYGTNDAIELTVDTTVDLGTRNGFYAGDSGAFVSPSIHKGYFNIINKSAKVDMLANTTWYLNGSFRFFAK